MPVNILSSLTTWGAALSLFRAVQRSDLEEIHRQLAGMGTRLLYYHSLGARETAWHVAASRDRVEALGALLAYALAEGIRPEQVPELLGQSNDKQQTPLIVAAWHGRLAALKWLLQQRANPWHADRCGHRTALHYAVLRGCAQSVEALLGSLPADEALRYVNAATMTGMTPLHYAAASNRADVARLLLQRGASLLAATTHSGEHELAACKQRSTPLHVAALRGHTEVALALLRHYYECMDVNDVTLDPRRRLDAQGRLPYQRVGSHSGALLAELLHPHASLQGLFGAAGGGEPRSSQAVSSGVPRLSRIASDTLRQQLLLDVQSSEAVIQGYRQRDLEGTLPEVLVQRQQPVTRGPERQACCPVRCQAGETFTRCSPGWSYARESEFVKQPMLPVVACSVCLDDAHCLVAEACHHRMCAECAKDVTARAAAMPLACPVCRCAVTQWSTVVC